MKRILLVLSAFALAFSASAATPKGKPAAKAPAKKAAIAKTAAPVETAHRKTPYVGAISADVATGRVLFEDNANAEAYPASVTKLMTALLVLEDVKAGRYALSDRATATAEAYHSEASWVGIKAGESMTVDDLLMALLVKSANDAAIVLGVHASGSLDAFVARMNARAAELGMTRTRYFNPNGLPPGSPPRSRRRYPWKEYNRSTAADQLKLAVEAVKHPGLFKYTSTKVAKGVIGGDGKPIPDFINHNNILVKDKLKILNPDGKEAVDGLKTGYIDAGGSSVVLTGSRKGKRAVVVVLGSSSSKERDEAARRLMNDALGALAW